MKTLFVLTSAALVIQAVFAQGGGRGQAKSVQETLVSPEVHADRTVTFRVLAPKATTVVLTGDWLATPAAPTGGTMPMTKGADGVWSATTAPLEATTHLYFFNVDGITMADPVNPKIKLRTRTSASLVEVTGDPTPVWQFRNVPHGSVDWNTQHSAAYDDIHEFMVYLPPGYHAGKGRYPVLYLVHGAGDTQVGWTLAGNAHMILDSLIAEKKAVPMIVVMPFNGTLAAGPKAVAANQRFEDYMVKELIPFVDANYRVAPGRKNRAMAGLSAGGAATFSVAFKHPELFSSTGMFSAAGGGGADFETRYKELAADAKGTNAKFPVIWIGCGTEDPLNEGAKGFDAVLTKANIKHTYKTREGGHVWPVWRWSLAEFAPLIFRS